MKESHFAFVTKKLVKCKNIPIFLTVEREQNSCHSNFENLFL